MRTPALAGLVPFYDVASQALFLALPFAVLLAGPFVVLFFAFCESNLNLDSSALIMQVNRDQGLARPLHLTDKFPNLFGLQQQLAGANRVGLNMA